MSYNVNQLMKIAKSATLVAESLPDGRFKRSREMVLVRAIRDTPDLMQHFGQSTSKYPKHHTSSYGQITQFAEKLFVWYNEEEGAPCGFALSLHDAEQALDAYYTSAVPPAPSRGEVEVAPGYELLDNVFQQALAQASTGKGRERHANDLPFHEQRMLSISKLLDSPKGMAYQVIKKLTEGLQMAEQGDAQRGKVELLGAINYLACIVILLEDPTPENPCGHEWQTMATRKGEAGKRKCVLCDRIRVFSK